MDPGSMRSMKMCMDRETTMSEVRIDTDNQVDPQDFLRHCVTRRSALKSAGVLAAGLGAAGLLSACSGGGQYSGNNNKQPDKKAEHSQPATVSKRAGSVSPTPREKTLLIDQAEFTVFKSFNPFIPNGEQYNGGLGQVCREYLWYFNMATGKTEPWLATKWEYADDYKTFTVHLNENAHWNDGKPFTAKDVVFSIDLIRHNPELLGSGPITDEMKSITAADDHTVVVKLKVSDPRYHYEWICGIVATSWFVVPEHVWKGKDPTSFKNDPPVYTGPYKLKETKSNLKMYVWEKDPNYWNKGSLDPKPQYVVYRSSPTADAEIEQFKNGACDNAGAPNTYSLVKAAISGGYNQAVITGMLDPCPRGIWINSDKSRKPLDDPRMHQVISALIDRKKMATSIWEPATEPAVYPWAAFDGNKQWENEAIAKKYALSYDPEKAKSLLDEMGIKTNGSGKRIYNGKPLSFEIITPTEDPGAEYLMGQLLAADLKKVGIGANLRQLASAPYNNKKLKGDFDIISEWLCGEVYDPWQVYNEFNDKYYKPVGKNATIGDYPRLQDAELSKACEQLAELDPKSEKAKPIFDKALDRYLATLPVVPTIQTLYTHQFNTTFWTGWPTDDNLYQGPANWWGQFMFVVGALKSTGTKVK
jgi:peptide/nickel transport system substrate-binding protein